MSALLLALGLALAGDGEPSDVITPVRDGVVVNWTHMAVEARSVAWGRGVASTRRVVEHEARQAIGPGILEGALGVHVTSAATVASLRDDPALGGAIEHRLGRWSVSEARYYASGKVELIGELSLLELLKPWALAEAVTPADGETQPVFTGVVVDARGTRAVPAFGPDLLAADGDLLWRARAWKDDAVQTTPVIYVGDPAHPAAVRAGANPLFLRASEARGSDLVLTDEDAVRLRTGMRGARVLGEGTVVVVIDP